MDVVTEGLAPEAERLLRLEEKVRTDLDDFDRFLDEAIRPTGSS